MNKRWISLLLAVLMFCSLFSAFAASSAAEDWGWTFDNGVLTVYGEGPMTDYRGNDNGRPWINVIDSVTEVVVEDGITHVGADAFTRFPNLWKVTCGSDVTSLGMDAFAYCDKLTTLVFNAPLETIGQGTVYGSSNLQSVTITGQTALEFLQVAYAKNYNDNYGNAQFTVIGAGDSGIAELNIVPMYGVLENYRDGTYFIVGGTNSYFASREKLTPDANGVAQLYLRVDITDETTKKIYIIPKYAFDTPDAEIYYDGSFLRIAVCEYGIVPVASHEYTIGLIFYDGDDKVVAQGISEIGAFCEANDDFLANGPIIPDPVPHRYEDPYDTDPEDPIEATGYVPPYKDVDLNSDRSIDICDVTALLNLLANSTVGQTDLNGDGEMTISDVTTLMSFLYRGIDDPFDLVVLPAEQTIFDMGGYAEGLRVKTTGELLFSPNLNELRQLIENSAHYDYDDFIGYLRFTDVGEDETYPSVQVEPKKSKGAWVDFFLMGNDIDCGFCPTAGVEYEIELAVALKSDPANAVYYGVYNFTAADSYATSDYYDPTPSAPANPNKTHILTFEVRGHGTLEGETVQVLKVGELSSTVTAIPDDGYVFKGWSDGVTEASRTGDTIRRDTTITAIFITPPAPDLPAVYIVTDSGQPILSKEYQTATISIVGTTTSAYDMTATTQIKGRGNSSWNGTSNTGIYDSKNSYSIKLDKKAKLLGLGSEKSKKWVLNANKFDLSGLRNWVCWDLADRMGTISFTPDCAWVQLYVNGEYRGMYMLCEKIDAAVGRVEVDDTITGTTDKGYLMELDFRGDWSGEEDPYFYVDGYGPNETVEFVIKSDIEGDQDIAFIQAYVQKMHNAIMSGDRTEIEKWADLPSLIDMYIIEELSKDCDAGRASFYIAKDAGGKVFFTAPWDFDFGFGTYGPATNTSGLVSQGSDCCTWFASLVTRAWFRQLVLNRMDELADEKDGMLEALREKQEELRTGADRNAERWNMYGHNFHGYVSYQVSGALDSWDEHIDFLADWINARWKALYSVIKNY